LPFLVEKGSRSIIKAYKNGIYLIGKDLSGSISMAVVISLLIVMGMAAFMLTFALGAVLVACASNLTVMRSLEKIEQAGLIQKVVS
jgi:hypothetical protein